MRNKTSQNSIKFRLVAIGVLVAVMHVFLLGRLYYLQVICHQDGDDAKTRMHWGDKVIEARRGAITDRNLRPLAMNRTRWNVNIDIQTVSDPENQVDLRQLVDRLGKILEWNEKTKAGQLDRIKKSKLKAIPLERFIEKDAHDLIVSASPPLKGIHLEREAGRYYPQESLASTALGYVNDDLQGMHGIEREYDVRLRGADVKVRLPVDRKRVFLSENDWTRSVDAQGQTLVLSLDSYIQFRTEKALKKAVEESEAEQGMAIVMEPYTGQILALCQTPDFDPNRFNQVTAFERKPRVITDKFEPGSVVKPFVVSMALEKGFVQPDTVFYCEKGNYVMRNPRSGRIMRTLRDDIHDFGDLTVHDILVCSSNIGTVKIAQLMGNELTYQSLQRFGFGRQSGIDLPSEQPGDLHPVASWSALSIGSVPYGQEMSANVVQIARAYAAFANGGYLVTPHLALGYLNSINGEFHPKPTPERTRVIPESVCKTITEILTDVTENHTDSDDPQARGTARDIKIPGYRIAAKTGTAQVAKPEGGGYEKGKRNASLAGYFPADNPRIVIYTLISKPQKGKYGGALAGPVFKEIAEALIPYWGLLPSHPEEIEEVIPETGTQLAKAEIPAEDLAQRLEDARADIAYGKMPNLRGIPLRECIYLLSETGVDAEIQGSRGFITKQSIAPGEKFEHNSLGKLTFNPDTEVDSAVKDSRAIVSRN